MANISLPFGASATRRAPSAELASGYPCGPLDRDLDNWLEWWATGQIARAMAAAGLAIDDTDLDRLARAIQLGSNYVVATGTANAWAAAPSLAPLAYALGLPFDVVAPATNTSTTVNMNVSGLGNRRIKKADGSDPQVGDLVAGTLYRTVFDGANIRIEAMLPSDIVAALSAAPTPPQLNFFELTTTNVQVVPTAAITVVNDLAVTQSKPSDAVFSAGGVITFGPKSAGVWSFSQIYVPSQVGGTPTVTQAYLQKNGLSYQNQTVTGTFCSNSGVIRVASGDAVRMAIYQNSGTNQKNQHTPALPVTTTFNLYQISS